MRDDGDGRLIPVLHPELSTLCLSGFACFAWTWTRTCIPEYLRLKDLIMHFFLLSFARTEYPTDFRDTGRLSHIGLDL